MKDIFEKIRGKWQAVLFTTFLVTSVVFTVSAFIPPKYSSEVRMIIIQNHTSEKVDAFSAAKSAEYLSDIISKVVFTESFLDDVMDSPFGIERDLPDNPEEKMETWDDMVEVDKVNNTGILEIAVFDRSKSEAEKIARSIAWSLNVRGDKYHGGGSSVEIKTIDGPITSEKPAKPNLLINTLLGLFVGLTGSLAAAYYFENFKINFVQDSPRRKKKDFKLFHSLDKSENKREHNYFQEDFSGEGEFDKGKNSIDLYRKEKLGETPGGLKGQKDQSDVDEKDFSAEKKNEPKKESVAADRTKKSDAPSNLPTMSEEDFMNMFSGEEKEAVDSNEKESNSSEFVSIEELEKEAENNEEKEQESAKGDQEASEEEIKDRLNKLLKGDL